MKLFIIGILSLALTSVRAQSLSPDDNVSKVGFTIKNFGFNVLGSLKGLKGSIQFNPSDLNASSFDVTVEASTINTGIDMRDEHLRSESFFDVINHPQIHFTSTRIVNSNKAGTFIVYGKLTIKATTKEISFPFTAQSHPDGFLFNGEFRLNRRDFSIGGSGTVSNELNVKLEVLAKK